MFDGEKSTNDELTSSRGLTDHLEMQQESTHRDEPEDPASRAKVPLYKLAWYFLCIALTTIQGAAGHLRRSVVQQRKLVSEKEFLESFALAEFLPQPDSTFGLAVHIGHRVRGIPGSIVVAMAMITPAFLLALLLGSAFIHFHKVSWVLAAAAGAGAAVCAVIGATLLEIVRKAVVDYRDFLMIMLVFVLLRYGILHISGVILWVTPLALWLHRPSRHEKLHGMQEPPGLIPSLGFRRFLRKRFDEAFNSERWGSLITAVFVVGMMGMIFSVERKVPPLLEKIQSTLIHNHKPEKTQSCPAIPFKPLPGETSEVFPIAPICTDLISTFSALSVCAFGGEETILPCLQRASVSHHNWMDKGEFLNFFSMSYLLPGPSMLATFIGLKACSSFGWGWAFVGALIAMLALFVPNMGVILMAAHSWDWLSQWRWRPSVGKALLLIASGALSAAFMFITDSAVHSTPTALIAVAAALVLLITDLNPVLVIMISGVARLLFLL